MSMTTTSNEIIWTVVVAAGSGTRFGGAKQFEVVGDRRVLDWATAAAHSVSHGIVVVVPESYVESEGGIAGGPTRSASVRCGLAAVPMTATIICVHDAARPFASEHLFREVVAAVHNGADGAVPALAVTDTIKQIDAHNMVVTTPNRAGLVSAQTPQAFRAPVLREAHMTQSEGTDDAALVEALGKRVVVIPGESLNRKLTTQEDLEWARGAARGEV